MIYKRMTIMTTLTRTCAQGNNKRNEKRKVVVTGDSLRNEINERRLSKDQQVKIPNFPGSTSETILKEIDTLVADKPNFIIIYAGTNDITNCINSLNPVKKILKKVKLTSPNTKSSFRYCYRKR